MSKQSWTSFLKSQLTRAMGNKHSIMDEADVLIRRKTNRYGPKGSMAKNNGYLKVARNEITGRFESMK